MLNGTERWRIRWLDAAGKTGSAQRSIRYWALFTDAADCVVPGFAPISNPAITVLVSPIRQWGCTRVGKWRRLCSSALRSRCWYLGTPRDAVNPKLLQASYKMQNRADGAALGTSRRWIFRRSATIPRQQRMVRRRSVQWSPGLRRLPLPSMKAGISPCRISRARPCATFPRCACA